MMTSLHRVTNHVFSAIYLHQMKYDHVKLQKLSFFTPNTMQETRLPLISVCVWTMIYKSIQPYVSLNLSLTNWQLYKSSIAIQYKIKVL